MNASEEYDFAEAFLSANANRQFISHQMADVLRELMRALVSERGSGMKAAEKMDYVAKLLQRCDEPLGWWDLLEDTLEILRSNAANSNVSEDDMDTATRGMKLLIECTSDDSFAAARISSKRSDLWRAINRR